MSPSSPSSPAKQDQDAMRVMVAAVVAQQAEFDGREAALKERERAIAEQERQLADRLAEKQQQLESLHEQLANAREQFRQEKSRQSALLDEAARIHAEAVEERGRLRELRAKFLKRWKRHWSGEEDAWRQKHQQLEAQSISVQQEFQTAQQLWQQIELEANQLRAEQAEWQQGTSRQASELASHRDAVNQRQLALNDAERRLHDERLRLEQECEALRAEARGLENRISHARRVLIAQELQQRPAALPAIDGVPESPAELPLPPTIEEAFAAREEYYRQCQAALHAEAAILSDQRSHLAEMCERLTQAEAEWQAKQIDAVGEMERLANDLQQREDALAERSRLVDGEVQRSRQEREQLARWRRELEHSAAELALRQSAQRGEWDRLRAEIAQRERFAERREKAMNDLLERWRLRRQAESDRLRKIANAAVEARNQFVHGRDQYHNRAEALRESQQALAEQALALEELRQEFLAETDRPQAAAKRFERLRRRWERRNLVAKRQLTRLQESLAAEDAQLREVYGELQTEQAAIATKEQELAQQLTELENERRKAGNIFRQFETARMAWLEQRRAYELQLTDLRTEIDRLRNLSDSPQRTAA